MQHDRVLKRLNFDLSTSPPKSIQGGETQAFDRKPRLICFCVFVPLSACEILAKNIETELLRNLRGQGVR